MRDVLLVVLPALVGSGLTLMGTLIASVIQHRQLDIANRHYLQNQRSERLRNALLKIVEAMETSTNALSAELYAEGRAALLLEVEETATAERFDEFVRRGQRRELVEAARLYLGTDASPRPAPKRTPDEPSAAQAHAARTLARERLRIDHS